jgi:hypothetical protein
VLDLHRLLAGLVVGVCALAAAFGGITYWRRREAPPLLAHALALAQTLLVAQVAVGLLLLSDGRRAADQLHYVYGTLALGVVLVPWFYAPADVHRRLLWFAACSAVAAALAIRALTTAG